MTTYIDFSAADGGDGSIGTPWNKFGDDGTSGNVNWSTVNGDDGILQIVDGTTPYFIRGAGTGFDKIGANPAVGNIDITIKGTTGNPPVITTEIEWDYTNDHLWTRSVAFPDCYWLGDIGGNDPSVTNPRCGAINKHYRSEQVNNDVERERWSPDQEGSNPNELTDMTDNNWAFGEFDSQGFDTIYVKVGAGGIDPTTLSQENLVLQSAQTECFNTNRYGVKFEDVEFRCGFIVTRQAADDTRVQKFTRCIFKYQDDKAFNCNNGSTAGSSQYYPQFIACLFWWSGHGAIEMAVGGSGVKLYNCIHVADHVAGKSTGTKSDTQEVIQYNNMFIYQGEGEVDWRDTFTTTGADDTSTAAAFLTDSGESWTADEFVGYEIRNTTDGSKGEIVGNTATEIFAGLSGGANNNWDSGDTYVVMKPDYMVITENYNIFMPRLAATPEGGTGGDIDGDLFYRNPIEEESGTATGGTATVMTDTATGGGSAWSTDEFKGTIIHNTTDGSSGVIVSNTSNTITVGDLTGGDADTFATDDAYFVEGFASQIWSKTGAQSHPPNVSTITHLLNGYNFPDNGRDSYRAAGNPLPRPEDVVVKFNEGMLDSLDSADLRAATGGIADGSSYAWWDEIESVSAPNGLDGVALDANSTIGAYGGTASNRNFGGSGGGGSVGSPVGTTVC